MTTSCAPLFVFGLARSGTNLISRMLNGHPNVRIALDPLMPVFRDLRNAVHAAAPHTAPLAVSAPFEDYYFDSRATARLDALLAGDCSLPITTAKLEQLRASVAERTSLESPELAARMEELNGNTYHELLRSALNIISKFGPPVKWVGFKEVWIIDFIPLLARAFPEARFYVIERDPRAIVASLMSMAHRDSTQAAHVPSYLRHWRKCLALSRRYAANPELADRVRVVSYESIVAEPEVLARQWCSELEIDFTPAMLRLSVDGWSGNSSFAHSGRDVYQGTVERWREYLSPAVITAAEFLCGAELALTNYHVESPASQPDGVVTSWLLDAALSSGSWRSDSGDAVVDLGGEFLRRALLDVGNGARPELVRRCFLFSETLAAIQAARADVR